MAVTAPMGGNVDQRSWPPRLAVLVVAGMALTMLVGFQFSGIELLLGLLVAGWLGTIAVLFRVYRHAGKVRNHADNLRCQLDDFTASSADMIWETDADGRLVTLSRGGCDLLEVPTDQIGSKRLTELFEASLAPRLNDALASQDRFRRIECGFQPVSGHRVFLSLRGAPVHDERGVYAGHRGTGVDITERRLIAEQQAKLLAIVNSSPDFIATFDLEGNIQFINEAGRKMIRIEPDASLEECSLAGMFPASEIDQLLNEGVPTAYMERFWSGETTLVTSAGEVLDVSQQILRHDPDAGGGQYFSMNMRDISERKAATAAILEAKEEAESAAQAKSAFLATVSHEIRTPLNGILGIAQLLQETTLDAEQYRYVDTLGGSGRSLLSIIDDVLDFATMDTGKLSLEPLCFDLSQVARQAVESLMTALLRRGSISP